MAETNQGANGRVFISYSRKDKPFVQKLNDALDNSGIQAWVDWEGIELAARLGYIEFPEYVHQARFTPSFAQSCAHLECDIDLSCYEERSCSQCLFALDFEPQPGCLEAFLWR